MYSFYNSLQPCVRKLQDWFGENSATKKYHDNQYEAQAWLILEFEDVEEYVPNTFINEFIKTEYFK